MEAKKMSCGGRVGMVVIEYTVCQCCCVKLPRSGFVQRLPCYDVASVRKRDGALRHDTFSSNAGHVRVTRERNAAVEQSRFAAEKSILIA
jgi:hypothetical protein